MIPVKREPPKITKEFKGVLEGCYFCDMPTAFWHIASNTPVCQGCAKEYLVRDLQGRLRFQSDRGAE